MASTVASPTLLYPPNSPGPKQGILLNPYANLGRSPRHGHRTLPLSTDHRTGRISAASSPGARGVSLPLPRTDSGSSTNSTSNAPDHQTHSRANSIRKIRFAPLPVPRALEEAELAQLESPVAAMYEDTPVTPGSTISHTSAGSASSTGGSLGLFSAGMEDPHTDTASEAGGTIKTVSGLGSATKSKSKHWSKRLLKPLLKSTSMKESGSISDDGLWRSASRDSIQSNTSNEGSPISRRMTFEGRTRHSSIGSTAGGAPLARIQSANGPRRKAMLNGRVYGAKPNAFQNIRDEEPDFVEWGHGGAGSVNNRHSAGSSKYAGVQSGGKLSIGAVAASASNAADDDDGSGMAWVKRRREQRERERREAEERERQKAQSLTSTSSITSEEAEKETIEMKPTEAVVAADSPAAIPEGHHIVTAIQVPAPPHVHHPHTHTLTHTHVQNHDVQEKPAEPSEQSAKSTSSESSDEENDEESDDEEDTDEDEDEEEAERRKTALGAGVEKVSRHKEEQ